MLNYKTIMVSDANATYTGRGASGLADGVLSGFFGDVQTTEEVLGFMR